MGERQVSFVLSGSYLELKLLLLGVLSADTLRTSTNQVRCPKRSKQFFATIAVPSPSSGKLFRSASNRRLKGSAGCASSAVMSAAVAMAASTRIRTTSSPTTSTLWSWKRNAFGTTLAILVSIPSDSYQLPMLIKRRCTSTYPEQERRQTRRIAFHHRLVHTSERQEDRRTQP